MISISVSFLRLDSRCRGSLYERAYIFLALLYRRIGVRIGDLGWPAELRDDGTMDPAEEGDGA